MIRYSPAERAQIGKYASIYGVTAAARYFTRKLKTHLSKSTVNSIQDLYLIEVWRRRLHDGSETIDKLPEKKKGRKLLLGEHLDKIIFQN